MKVSVIIPAYKAAAYLEQAVKSALNLPQVAEILLVEDGCPDPATLPLCKRLAETHERVRLFRHPRGGNRGAGSSRNLGIINAISEYIAFLDADDFYLPNRFEATQRVFESDPTAEAVYEHTGTYFQTKHAEQIWTEQKRRPFTCIESGIPPEELFESMFPIGKRGKCHLTAMTLKRHVINRIGMFPDFSVGEDTVFEMKVAAGTRWLPGQLSKPVVMRRVHEENRTTGCASGQVWSQSSVGKWRGRMKIYLTIIRLLRKQTGQEKKIELVLEAIRRDSKNLISRDRRRLGNSALLAYCFAVLVGQEPRLLKHTLFVRGFLRDIYYSLRK